MNILAYMKHVLSVGHFPQRRSDLLKCRTMFGVLLPTVTDDVQHRFTEICGFRQLWPERNTLAVADSIHDVYYQFKQ